MMSSLQKSRIGIFGGSFDPPHLGHSTVAQSLVHKNILDEVWFVPVKQHPLGKQVSSEEHRVAMLELLLKHHLPEDTFKINTIELESSGPSYSLKTLRALAEKHPEHEFSWIMGSDNLRFFHNWWQYQALLQEFPILVYPREGAPNDSLYKEMSWLGELPTIAVSSTQVREYVKESKSITELVGEEIAQYIREHELYA